jgi:hypothetical protein
MTGRLRSLWFFAVAVAVTLATAASQARQSGAARPGQTTPPQVLSRERLSANEGTTVLRGRVLAADTGGPLRRARVSLSAVGTGQHWSVSTDVDGRYEFTRLPGGRYTLMASKVPYVALQVGQRSPFEAGRPIEFGEGQTVGPLDMVLPRGCVIAGSVYDDLGEPADSVGILALRQQYFEGRRQLVPVGRPALTNDVGQYRLYGLPPGTYVIRTLATAWNSMSPLDTGISYAATYYPGSIVETEAQPVTVRVGQERLNVNVSLVVTPMARLSGVARDSGGRPLAGGSVTLLQAMHGPSSMTASGNGTALVQPDGRFTIPSVAAGEYVLAAYSTSPQIGRRESAWLPVLVTGEDLDGLLLTTSPTVSITGRIEFEGNVPPPISPGTVQIRAHDLGEWRGPGPGVGTVHEDRSFEVSGITPGPHVLRVSALPPGWALKAVYVGGHDVTDAPFEVEHGRNIAGVTVVITNRVTELSGLVSDDLGKPVEDYSLVVFADDAAHWCEQSRYLAAVRPDQHGRYVIQGLPPGEYLAVALEYVEEGESSDPELLETLRPHALAFTLGDGERKHVDLKLLKVM